MDENGEPRRKRRRRRGRRGGRERSERPQPKASSMPRPALPPRPTASAPCRTRSTPRPATRRHAPGAPSAPVWSLKDDELDTTPQRRLPSPRKKAGGRRHSAANKHADCTKQKGRGKSVRPFSVLMVDAASAPPRPRHARRDRSAPRRRLVAGNHVDRVVGRRARAAQVAALAQRTPARRFAAPRRAPPPCRWARRRPRQPRRTCRRWRRSRV